MQFASRTKRRAWFYWALGLLPDLVISVLVATLFHGGVVGVVGAFFALQILYLLIWIKNSIWAWTMFSIMGRKQLAKAFEDGLRENKYPEPQAYLGSPQEYFESIVTNEDVPLQIRLKASADIGMMQFPASQGLVQLSIRLSTACEDAIEAYKRGFRPSSE